MEISKLLDGRITVPVQFQMHRLVTINDQVTTTPTIAVSQELETVVVRELLNLGPATDFFVGSDRYLFKGYEIADVPVDAPEGTPCVTINLLVCPPAVKLYNVMAGNFIGQRGVVTGRFLSR